MPGRGSIQHRRHRIAFLLGLVLTLINLLLVIGLLCSWLGDVCFLVLAGTAPWSLALLGVGMIPPKEIHDIKWAD